MGRTLRLFEAYGIELEYMIVRREGLDVLPVCDRLMEAVAGPGACEHSGGPVDWSNELALHVLEFKTAGPAPGLNGLAAAFQRQIEHANRELGELGGCLLPGAMHPWMDPEVETRLWPHENGPVYRSYDRIFGCRGHGWSNLQSAHLNLPFAGDEEFGRLHAAIRAVLPLLPGLAASSPVVEGRWTGLRDSRLDHYRRNQARLPSITGQVVPEPVRTIQEYHDRILAPIYRDIAPLDTEHILQHEWLNSRGAIARFDRDAIEIRVLDVQETPAADLAIAWLVTETLRALTEERWASLADLHALDTGSLAQVLVDATRDAEDAQVEDPALLGVLGHGPAAIRLGDLWSGLRERLRDRPAPEPVMERALEVILAEGTLARRLLRALGPDLGPGRQREVFGELADCLASGHLFDA